MKQRHSKTADELGTVYPQCDSFDAFVLRKNVFVVFDGSLQEFIVISHGSRIPVSRIQVAKTQEKLIFLTLSSLVQYSALHFVEPGGRGKSRCKRGGAYLFWKKWKKTYLFWKNQGSMKSEIFLRSLFFTDRRTFRINLTYSEKSWACNF